LNARTPSQTSTGEEIPKIGIPGSGSVATVLAAGLIKHGHEVTLGTRQAARLAEVAKANPRAEVAWFADAAKFAEVIVRAVKGTAAQRAPTLAGADNLKGKAMTDD
jgi:3-hydroxyisobutyrate dehydrogenase-like beta-hydroxyacid dehydrogenase